MEETNKNHVEYTVSRKAEGKYLKAKILWISIYALLVIAYVGVLALLSNYAVLLAICTLPFIPVIVIVLRGSTWYRFVKCDYKYEIANAKITFTEIHGRFKKELFSDFVSAAKKIAPLTDEYKAEAEGADVLYDCRRSASDTEDIYFIVFEKDGKKTVIYIEAVKKALDVMKYYNSKNIVMSEVRY